MHVLKRVNLCVTLLRDSGNCTECSAFVGRW